MASMARMFLGSSHILIKPRCSVHDVLRFSLATRHISTVPFATSGKHGVLETRAINGRRQSSRLKTLPQKNDSESDDEHGQKKKLSRKKRAKTSTSRSGKRSLLPTMSMDVLYSIFSHLPPKYFRKALISPDSTFLWTVIRKSCRVPDPFPGTLSELDSIRLLFGNKHCQECGHNGVQDIKYHLHKRICSACVYKTGVSKGRFRQYYPREDKKILDLIIPTYGGRKNQHTDYYDTSEIDRILAGFGACKNPKEVERYTEKRRKHLKRLTEHVDVCIDWENYDRYNPHYDSEVEDPENVRVRAERFKAIRCRLVAMGYTDEDIKIVKNLHCEATKDQSLIDRAILDRLHDQE